jgi:outer membrane lipoprotein-sorting protein
MSAGRGPLGTRAKFGRTHSLKSSHFYYKQTEEKIMRRFLLALAALALCAAHASAQTADEIVAKFVKTVGGMEKIQAVKSLRRSGKYTGGGGFEAVVIEENKRPNLVRQEILIQGMTGITAYDGKSGWKIEPWSGKKDAEGLSEEEMKSIIEDSDLDGPLINHQQKGIKVEYVGTDEVEGTDTFKLKVTMPNGDVRFYYMDTDYFVPIKVDTKRMIRGAEREFETILGDYKEVNGWYLPFSIETGVKGSQNRAKVTYEKIEANVALEDARFRQPAAAGAKQEMKAPDASETLPKKPEEKKAGDKPAGEKPEEKKHR